MATFAPADHAPFVQAESSTYGWPYGEQLCPEPTVCAGKITALRAHGPDGHLRLQIPAAVTHGSSVGPLLNNRHEVIGVVLCSLRHDLGVGFNYAVDVRKLYRRIGLGDQFLAAVVMAGGVGQLGRIATGGPS